MVNKFTEHTKKICCKF